MKIILTIVSIFFALLQSSITYYWQNEGADVTSKFTSTLESIYGQVPAWSHFAFSMGSGWYFVAIFFVMGSIAAYFLVAPNLVHASITLLSAVTAIAMTYAMYPIHLMVIGNSI